MKKQYSTPAITQFRLEEFLGRRRELLEIEEELAMALSMGARVEAGVHKAELIPEHRAGNGIGAGLRMKLVIMAFLFAALTSCSAGGAAIEDVNGDGKIDIADLQEAAATPLSSSLNGKREPFAKADGASTQASAPRKESKKDRKRRERAEQAAGKSRAEQAAWEEATRPPEPPYPGSITHEFARAAAQATIVIDNAFNSMSKSRVEFAIANQSSIQYAASLAALSHNDGERQVSAILYVYAQKIPVCQEAAWEALKNVISLVAQSGGVRACTYDLRRLRAQADRTFDRNRAERPPRHGAPSEHP